jgi:hypothetical protein
VSARVVREPLAELDLSEHVTYLARDRPGVPIPQPLPAGDQDVAGARLSNLANLLSNCS